MHQIVVELPLFHMALSACARITAIEGMAMSSLKLKYFEYVMLSRVCREDVENLEETLTPTEIASPYFPFLYEDISLLFFSQLGFANLRIYCPAHRAVRDTAWFGIAIMDHVLARRTCLQVNI